MKPYDPRCGRYAEQIPAVRAEAAALNLTPEEWVLREEGTYNPDNGHFSCDACYIEMGMPSKPFPERWVTP